MLTGTLTDTSQTDEDIYASVAPNIFRVKNNPEADPIATLVVENLESGFSLPQTIIELRQKVSGEDLKAYEKYAETISKEMGEFKSAIGKRTTPASEAGLPEPNAQFDPTSKMGGIYALLNEQMQPKVAPSSTVPEKKKETGFIALAKTLNPFKGYLSPQNPDPYYTTPPHLRPPNLKPRKQMQETKQGAEEEKYAAANLSRGKIADIQSQRIKEALATGMQRNSLAGTPFMDELLKRTIMKRLIENPGAISKLQNPKG